MPALRHAPGTPGRCRRTHPNGVPGPGAAPAGAGRGNSEGENRMSEDTHTVQAVIEGTPEQVARAEEMTGRKAIPVIVAEGGEIVPEALGPGLLGRLARHAGTPLRRMKGWEELEKTERERLLSLTVNSAPWAMDREIPDEAFDEMLSGLPHGMGGFIKPEN